MPVAAAAAAVAHGKEEDSVCARSVRSSVCRKEGREEEEKKERVRLPLPSSFHISSYRSLLGRGRECKCALCFSRNWKIVCKCRRGN